jgi:hypothetical protein
LFCSRGTQVKRTLGSWRTSSDACFASGFIAGCLTCQRPLICSTISLESIRTSTSAGASAMLACRPAMRPPYSATLLVALPMPAARSANTSPVTASRTTAP